MALLLGSANDQSTHLGFVTTSNDDIKMIPCDVMDRAQIIQRCITSMHPSITPSYRATIKQRNKTIISLRFTMVHETIVTLYHCQLLR